MQACPTGRVEGISRCRRASFKHTLARIAIAQVLLAGTPGALTAATSPAAGPYLQANPPLPPPATFPVQLVLDDDSSEGVFGIVGSTARQFLFFNRFVNPGPFILEEIWVLFPDGMDIPPGGDVQVAVFLDPDGNPATGAQLLATYDTSIQAADGATFSVYSLAAPLAVDDPGDVLIGVVNRYFNTGIDPPPTLPAALDRTVNQGRSYFAFWAGDPPPLPDLASAMLIDMLDGATGGNLMIRGFGRPAAHAEPTAVPVPVVGGGFTWLLAGLVALLGWSHLRRRRQRLAG